ncbi:MAG: RagB/SusD family nutrient uptake outer membrane protein [Prevotella sp.]
MKKFFSMIIGTMLLASCMDMELLPNDKTVEEDFWQSKSDVSQMVNGAYNQFAKADVVKRLIVWGDFRSDEMIATTSEISGTNTTRVALSQIEEVAIETTNMFAEWASFYTVINYCNIVLEKAGNVRNIDPNYTDGDYQTDRSQMLALRALCYFYLVRTFRDVPYTNVAYLNSTQDMVIKQLPPTEVLQYCINDLEEASKNALSSQLTGWKAKGYITLDAIHAMLADIYLWRGSVTHSQSDYQAAVAYADKVIDAKKAAQVVMPGRESKLPNLTSIGADSYTDLFGKAANLNGGSEESIFELQFCEERYNEAVNQLYNKYANNNSGVGYLTGAKKMGTAIGTTQASNDVKVPFAKTKDYRYWNSTYAVLTDVVDGYPIRKMVAQDFFTSSLATVPTKGDLAVGRTYTGFAQNFIIYRLADVMLMKAEALVAMTSEAALNSTETGEDAVAAKNAALLQLQQAFNMVWEVNTRSLDESAWASDSLRWNAYKNKTKMEELVLQERQRELCYEGKRWFDLLRYNYRHQDTPCQYHVMMVDQDGKYMESYDNFLQIIQSRYTEGNASARTNKMKEEPRLYLPVPHRDILTAREWLHQNPMYQDEFTE